MAESDIFREEEIIRRIAKRGYTVVPIHAYLPSRAEERAARDRLIARGIIETYEQYPLTPKGNPDRRCKPEERLRFTEKYKATKPNQETA